jgi:hypothetical protein
MGKPIDDRFLLRYRLLLDAEDHAFDELEHAVEDGDRRHFTDELQLWRKALEAKLEFLETCDYDLDGILPGPIAP